MSKIGDNGGPPIRDAGWYATHRDMLNHPIVGAANPVRPNDPSRGAFSRFEAWHWLIANAAYAERRWLNRGEMQTLERGQVVAGRAYLAHQWNWSEKQVRLFLDRLINELMITVVISEKRGQQRANTANIITLCNYMRYQLGEDELQVAEGPAKGQQRASEGPAKGHIDNKGTKEQDISVPYGTSSTSPGEADQLPLDDDAETDAKPADPFAAEDGETSGRKRRLAINRAAAVEAFALWRETAANLGLVVPRETSFNVFGRTMAARMFEHADDPKGVAEMVAVWKQALEAIERSRFLRGMTDNPFRCDLKFIVQKQSFVKILEGGYGNGAHAAPTSGRTSSPAEVEERRRKLCKLAGMTMDEFYAARAAIVEGGKV